MRVICVDTSIHNKTNKDYAYLLKLIKEGEVYTVENIVPLDSDETGYTLIEIPGYFTYPFHLQRIAFASCRFIETSGIDETELVNNKQEEYA